MEGKGMKGWKENKMKGKNKERREEMDAMGFVKTEKGKRK